MSEWPRLAAALRRARAEVVTLALDDDPSRAQAALARGSKGKLAGERTPGKTTKRIVLTNSAPFPWVKDPTQGKSMAFHYDDLGMKWDHPGRNAFFSTFASKGTIK
jgi:hypothetical protein